MAVKKLRAATLVESLTALTIVSTVMGAAFTLYEKTNAHQQQVMRTQARLVQASVEQQLPMDPDHTFPGDLLLTTVDIEPYRQQNDVKLVTLRLTTKQGKTLLEKKYLVYQPQEK